MRESVYKGQSLAEYVIVGGVLTLTAIGSLMALQGSFETLFVNASQRLRSNNVQAAAAAGNNALNQQPVANVNDPAAGFATVELTLSDGSTLSLADFPVDPAGIIETSGGSGYTDKLVLSISQLADGLRQNGEISEQQYTSLINLANKGHSIARIQQALETAMAPHSSITPVNQWNEQITIDGVTKTMFDWSKDIGFSVDILETSTMPIELLNTMHPGETANSFFNAYLIASKDLAGSTAATAVLGHLSREILMLGELGEHVVGTLDSSTNVETVFVERYVEKIDKNSNDICHLGNGTDTGVSCS